MSDLDALRSEALAAVLRAEQVADVESLRARNRQPWPQHQNGRRDLQHRSKKAPPLRSERHLSITLFKA